MRPFDHYVKFGIVKRRTPQLARARSLVDEACQRKRFIDEMEKKMPLADSNANYFVENAYDSLIGLCRAKLITDGYYASGKGAHEAEISYLMLLGFSQQEIFLLDDLRERRNGIKYYGKECDTDYAKRIISFCKKLFPRLRLLAQGQ